MRPNLNPLHTSFHPPSSSSTPRPQDQPTTNPSPTTSPTSPTTTASISSPSPPTSPFFNNNLTTTTTHRPRRLHHTSTSTSYGQHRRGRLPTRDRHPYSNNANTNSNTHPPSSSSASASPSPGSPFRLSACSLLGVSSSSPRPSSTIFLRRRPSRTEVALREERWRAEEDNIERLGLEMLEPRPSGSYTSGPYAASAALGIGGFEDAEMGLCSSMSMSMDGAVEMDSASFCSSGLGVGFGGGLGVGYGGQRVVMEGIFEVMEEGR
ncbi:uncharacterized protein LDX57_003714 [Aspergillus melleus]|uniref:uncharacterized protein n=1 Tax=Aspergillus melleus TaxID=138277 RepID=UPI001E8D12B7|nr:uncharacterized protein LDX57_003714 [Aspergillus melleus]KAH8425975.1 hypothetical protein LDX57_003714 [Aspergillus melleus]